MIDDLLAILAAFKYPVFLHGSVNPDDGYPDSFFTFWNQSTPEGAFYSNYPHFAVWQFYIYFYSSSRQTVETVTDNLLDVLRASGWTLRGRPADAVSGVATHTGRMLICSKLGSY